MHADSDTTEKALSSSGNDFMVDPDDLGNDLGSTAPTSADLICSELALTEPLNKDDLVGLPVMPSSEDFALVPAKSGTKPKKFTDEAMRVICACEQLLMDSTSSDQAPNREHVLKEISQLRKRFGRSTGPSPSRCSISRHRRYSLGIEARRVLKGWVDEHITDPYPSIQGKIL